LYLTVISFYKELARMGRASTRKKLKKLLSPLKEKVKAFNNADGYFVGSGNSFNGGNGGNGFNGVIVNVQGRVAEDFRLADQQYFEQHPSETEYVRPSFPGEFPEVRQPRQVRVTQLEPGTRTRIGIW
jgi:hypothetical protein